MSLPLTDVLLGMHVGSDHARGGIVVDVCDFPLTARVTFRTKSPILHEFHFEQPSCTCVLGIQLCLNFRQKISSDVCSATSLTEKNAR